MNAADLRIALYISPWRSIRLPTGVGQHAARMCAELACSPGVRASLLATRDDYAQAREHLPAPLAAAPVACLPRSERLTRMLMLGTRLLPIERFTGEQDWVYCPKEQPVATRRARLAVTVHDVRGLEPSIPGLAQPSARQNQLRWRLLMRQILRRADLIATVSEFTRRRLLDLFGSQHEDRIVVVGNGVGDAYFGGPETTDQAVLKRFGVADRPYVCLVGSLTYRKGGDLILSLAERIMAERLPHRIIVSGRRHDAQLLARYESLKAERPQLPVDLPGYVADSDQAALLRHSAALVFPSRYEGFGIPVLEAMAAGAPVICSRAAALPEIAGDAATYLETDSIDELLTAVRHVEDSTNGRAAMIERGRRRAAQFTWRACAEKLLAGMQSIDASAERQRSVAQ